MMKILIIVLLFLSVSIDTLLSAKIPEQFGNLLKKTDLEFINPDSIINIPDSLDCIDVSMFIKQRDSAQKLVFSELWGIYDYALREKLPDTIFVMVDLDDIQYIVTQKPYNNSSEILVYLSLEISDSQDCIYPVNPTETSKILIGRIPKLPQSMYNSKSYSASYDTLFPFPIAEYVHRTIDKPYSDYVEDLIRKGGHNEPVEYRKNKYLNKIIINVVEKKCTTRYIHNICAEKYGKRIIQKL